MKYPLQDDGLWLPGEDDVEPSRRTFLKLAGFGVASAGLAGCSRAPSEEALVPAYPEVLTTAGLPYSVATACGGCSAACGILARCRDGRPIKVEGNPEDPRTEGGLCATGQGQILELYDGLRPRGPQEKGKPSSWIKANEALAPLRSTGRVRILTGTITSPSTRSWIERYLSGCKDGAHVEIDAISSSAALDAHARTHGERALPTPRLDRARVVACFGADPLGTGLNPVEHTRAWSKARRPESGPLSQWWQFEATQSLTGGAADRRLRLAPWEYAGALAYLVEALATRAGRSVAHGAPEDVPHAEALEELAEALWSARGEALVLVGGNDLTSQLLANHANDLLDAYGNTLDWNRSCLARRGDDSAAAELAEELAAGSVDLLIVEGCNPAYERPDLAPHLREARTLVVCSMGRNETTALADWHLPTPHALEAWGDEEAETGILTLRQPTLPLLFDGRTLRSILAGWCGVEQEDRELVEEHLRSQVYPRTDAGIPFDKWLADVRQLGVVVLPAEGRSLSFEAPTVQVAPPERDPSLLGVVLYEKVGLRSGAHAHNPWLQELPDPISRITWDNYACLSPERAAKLGLAEGEIVRLEAEGVKPLELPVHVQPGQHDDIVAVALGYGRAGTDRFAGLDPEWIEGRATIHAGETIGVAASPWLAWVGGRQRTDTREARLVPTGASVQLADIQDYNRLELPAALAPKGAEVRDNIRLADADGHLFEHGEHHPAAPAELWPEDHPRPGHRWAMAIDLSACTGCSACVVSCQAENNVPVVGRDEVRRHREMHWIRVDRYYRGEDDDMALSYQPMMCHHCDNAPCEAVCPVLATVHSSEGLNQQVYNRCVGTRYCANTCPYKVRRFNWFEYRRDDATANHALNPDVVVRDRGVMEKCSFCAQRIAQAKAAARREGRPIQDGEIRTACQQSCPAEAIVFGDLADPDSAITRAMENGRTYKVLEELNIKPSVAYLAEARHHHPASPLSEKAEAPDVH